ncbi:MAG: hypothetical protein QNI94_05565 [Kiloniellales bacterium]|nr:hypothetical protein [Kiloniellales bacterium]
MPTRLQAFLAQQRARGMSDQAIRRALGLSRQEAAEAELFGSKEAVGRPAVRERRPSVGPGRRP